jgi:transcriptional antiterminator RfaH
MASSGSEDNAADTGEPPASTVEPLAPGEEGQEWYAFRTRPRQEKKAADRFADLSLHHYLPLRERVTRKGRGRYSFQVPLFPGYIFGCCDLGERLQMMQSGHLAQWIEVVDQSRLLEELRGIEIACQSGQDVRLFPKLQRGRWVRVVSGPLAGVSGRISRRESRYRVVLELTALGSAVAVEVDMQDVALEGETEPA